MKQLFKGHKFIEIRISLRWIVHTALPLIILDRIDFVQKRNIYAVKNVSHSLVSENHPYSFGFARRAILRVSIRVNCLPGFFG